jgi:transcription antitermination factor NusB
MKSRRACREAALQVLYQCDVTGDYSPEAVELCLVHFCSHGEEREEKLPEERGDGEALAFSRSAVLGVIEHLKVIDDQIGLASTHWSIARMPRVDRNLLRLAVYELMFCSDIPPKVSINEALEIAKRFSADDAPTFINGVLDRVLSSLPARRSEGEPKNLIVAARR